MSILSGLKRELKKIERKVTGKPKKRRSHKSKAKSRPRRRTKSGRFTKKR